MLKGEKLRFPYVHGARETNDKNNHASSQADPAM
jgi:hypothetical protein